MSIWLFTGGLGSGKSYLTVVTLAKTYFDYNKETGYFKKKEQYKDLQIISNIEGLQLDHISLDKAINASGLTLKQFFTVDYQQKILRKYKRILYVIDEVQGIFRKRFYDDDVFFFFEKSRHDGFDFYLITQNKYRIPREISDLAETEIRAIKRTLLIAGELK